MFLGAFAKFRKANMSFVVISDCRSVRLLLVRLEQLGSHWTDSHEIWCVDLPKIRREKSSFIKLTGITDTLHEDQYTFFIISRSFLLITRKVLDKSCRGNQNTHFMFSNFFFLENRAVCDTVWYDIYLLQLGFDPVAVVGKLVQKQERDNYLQKEKLYTKQENKQKIWKTKSLLIGKLQIEANSNETTYCT